MIHGFGGSARNFSKLAEELKDSFRIIRVDIPGFGLSDLPQMGEHPAYVPMYRDYISFLLDTLHLDSVYVIGNSMGGGIAWLAAVDHPDRVIKLVLIGSGGYDAVNIASKLTMFKYTSMRHIFDKGMPEFMSKNAASSIYADPRKMESEVWQSSNHFMNREGNIQNMLELVTELQFPDTVVSSDDALTVLEGLFSRAKRDSGDYETVFGFDRKDFGIHIPFLSNAAVDGWRRGEPGTPLAEAFRQVREAGPGGILK